ncbi:unnamed protein product [Paramecium primaurelia]|uniref:Uncharacterized protein n=1 Tax=Paramecium primaurelia TaxID=5886 RepID=A0A8S1NZV4_PARPR|nr:unnamed protein product [Paramecium primaurelia]CAD8095348.1 unnamed protein product [Paramecium primaurelia]
MQITQNSHSPPPAKKQHLKLHVQPIQLPDANVLNKTVGNSDPEIGSKSIKTERVTAFKQNKKFHIKQVQHNTHNRLQTNHPRLMQQENDGLSLILYKQSQTSTSEKIITKQLVNDLRNKIDQQDSVIRLQEFKINRLQQELISQKQYCSNLLTKIYQNDPKSQYISTVKVPKLGFQFQENTQLNSQQQSLLKISNNHEYTKIKNLQNQIILFKQKQSEFKNFVKDTFLSIKKIIQSFEIQTKEKIQSVQMENKLILNSLEEMIKNNNIQNKEELSKINQKAEIICQELVLAETQKEVYYQKCLSLLS